MGDTREVNGKYYRKNGETLKAKKRNRYSDDPEYREAAKRRAAERYSRLRKNNAVTVQGTTTIIGAEEYYTTGYIIDKADVASSLFFYYLTCGYIKRPPQIGSSNTVLFTKKHADAVISALKEYRSRDKVKSTDGLQPYIDQLMQGE